MARIMELCKISEAMYSFQCPVNANWKHREKSLCYSGNSYFCLYDQNEHIFTEFCRNKPDFEAPGQKLIVAGSFQGTLQGADCDNDFYQPFQFWSSGNSRCVYKKSYCSEEGQIISSNGTEKTDSVCRCDYTRGFDFIVRPNHRCYCEPAKEDCSCYLKSCSSNEILSPDYECLDRNEWKTSFICVPSVTVVLPEYPEILSTVTPLLRPHLSVYYGIGKYRKGAGVAVFVLFWSSILIALIFWILASKYVAFRIKNLSKELENIPLSYIDEENQDNFPTVAYAINKTNHQFVRSNDAVKDEIHNRIRNLEIENLQEFQIKTLQDWKSVLQTFVNTTATNVLFTRILVNNVVLIVGATGSGKSANAYDVAFRLKREHGYTIIPVRKPIDIINYHIPGTQQVFIIDDFIGKYVVDETDVVLWEQNGPLLKMLFSNTNQSKLILTIRTYIWQPERYTCLSIPFCTCDLLSEELKLSLEERRDIFRLFINTDDATFLNDDEIMMFNCLPLLCSMYSSSRTVPLKHFFTVPFQIIEDDINNFKTKSHISLFALAVLAIKERIATNSFTIDNHEHKELLEDLFHESTLLQYPSKKILISTLSAFKAEYVKESDSCFEFVHETMQNMILCCIAKTFIQSVIKHCKIGVLLNQIKLESLNGETDFHAVHVQAQSEDAYFQRLVSELNKGFYKEVFESKQNLIPQFRVKFLEHIKQNKTRDQLKKTENGMTALHIVVALGYHEYSSFFIQEKQMIYERDTAGNIPLHLACIKGHLQTVKDLVNKKSFIDVPNNEDLSPFFYACENGFFEVVEYLLQYSNRGIRVNDRYTKKKRRCVLHVVSANGYTNLTTLLLKNNAEVDAKDEDGCTPLHLACYNGHSKTVTALLNGKANVEAKDSSGNTSVYIACEKNHECVLKQLLDKKAVVNHKTNIGMTPLRVSCRNENISIVKMLLERKPKVNSHKSCILALHEACEVGNVSITNILIEAKASINHKTKEGITPLHQACMKGHDNVVNVLLNNTPKVNKQDNHGLTALYYSSSKGFPSTVDLLLANKAHINISDEDQITPLMIACKENHTDVVEVLLRSKADVNYCDKDNRSALIFACINGNIDLVKLLLKYSAEINLTDKYMMGPLHTACTYNKTNIVLELLKNKANINAADQFRQTSLFKSSCNGFIEIVEILLSYGASVDIRDTSGVSPIDIAERNGHRHVVEVFRQYQKIN
ncbi:uncharacterized protein [Mytilus edulis]|uniref:uncharacterized protein n=1 Tax=Mytilus edulis TaxID=6550 RepID=UPI0039F0E0EB